MTQVEASETHVSGQSNAPMSQPAHALSFDQVAEELKADIMNGLNETEASQRLETFGNNDLGDAEGIQPLKIILAQVANAMTLVSLSASGFFSYSLFVWPFSAPAPYIASVFTATIFCILATGTCTEGVLYLP